MDIEERLKKLKLIVFDLDGTLLSDDGNIGADTKSLIKELKKLDVCFSFAEQKKLKLKMQGLL